MKAKKARISKTFVPSNTSQRTGHILNQCRIREEPNQLRLPKLNRQATKEVFREQTVFTFYGLLIEAV